MLLIEADGKALLAEHGVVVPAAVLTTNATVGDLKDRSPGINLSGNGPWMVKAQVPVGGRGKVGGIVRCDTPQEAAGAARRLLGQRLKGHQVDVCLIEQKVTGASQTSSTSPSFGSAATRSGSAVLSTDRGGTTTCLLLSVFSRKGP